MAEENIIIKSNNEINIFISSNGTDEDFLVIRENLKKRIEDTGIAQVYLFEQSSASTLDAEPYYTFNVDTSDICVFIINNAEEIPEGVMKEYNRAKAINKKSLYIFFGNDKDGEANIIKKELTGPSGVKYYNLEESTETKLKDVEDKVYQSVIDDISYIYKLYSNEYLVVNSGDNSSRQISKSNHIIETKINKQLLKNLGLTKSYINKQIYSMSEIGEKDRGTNLLDEVTVEFLKVVFGEKSINDFNPFYLLNELKIIQDESLHEVIRTRWESIIYYWSGNPLNALEKEKEALHLAESSNMPNWLVQDILIDIRNLDRIYGQSIGQIRMEGAAQKKINQNTNPLFYPIIDRYDKDLNEKLLDQVKKSTIKSPYTISYGNSLSIYGDLMANSFFVGLYYGSLTHIRLFISKIKDLSFFLCQEYSDWEFRVLFLKTSLHGGASSEIEKSINYFNDIYGKMNDKDAIQIYSFVSSQPITFERILSQTQTFKYLGYYFNEVDYEKVYNEMLNIFDENIVEDLFSNLVDVFFSAIINNIIRIDNNDLFTDIIIPIFEKDKNYLNEYAFEIIQYLEFKNLNKNSIDYLVDLYKSILDSDESNKLNNQAFLSSLIITRLNLEEQMNTLDIKVKEKLPDFFNRTYKHEISKSDEDKEFINEQITKINKRLEEQGVNGRYIGFAGDPFKTIINIIENTNIEVDQNLYDLVMDPLLKFVLSKNQFYTDKVRAIQLMSYIQSKANDVIDNFNLYKEIINNKNKVISGQESLDKFSRLVLNFNYELLIYSFNQDNAEKILSLISLEKEIEKYEIIECIKALSNLVTGKPITDSTFEVLIVNLLIMTASDKNEMVRLNSLKVLIKILNFNNKKYILTKISNMMDFDTLRIKSLIIQSLDIIQEIDYASFEDIIVKAKIDNSFAVRKLVEVSNYYKT